jgi:uncharacterized membrane protein YhaH (DUF805 family)
MLPAAYDRAVVDHKDVVTAILGAAAALAGLTLVFLGMIVNAYQDRGGVSSEAVRKRYMNLAAFVLCAFVASLTCVGLATIWMLDPKGVSGLYVPVVVVFLASLVILLLATVLAVRRLLARGS